jgi:hypothetical protein
MIRKIFPYLLALGLAAALTACANSPSPGSGGGISADSPSGEPIAKSQGEADFLDQRFDFSMEAYLKEFDVSTLAGSAGANLYPAIMNSIWSGEFTINPDGNLFGQEGKLVTEATIFNVDEDWCGYAFTDLAEYTFEIGGTLKKQGDKYKVPIKIWSLTLVSTESSIGPPEATCEDPDPRYADPTMVKVLIPTHRNAMVNLVMQHLHQEVGDQIEMGIPLEVEAGKVEYQIFISPEAVDLNE